METNKYLHYFDIDEEFFSAVNQQLIDEGKVDWHKFFPHETFVKLLKDTVSVLTKQHLSIWVEGGYGTGKSYAVLTLKKLLEANEEETRAYFQRYNLDHDLLNKFLNVKSQGQKIVTVHRYGAQSILNEQDLVLAVQESIRQALIDNNVEYLGEASLKDSVITWLSNAVNKMYFNTIIKDEFPTEFGGDDVDRILEKLRTYEKDQLIVLMNTIFKVARKKGIHAMTLDKEGMVKWIQDVIKANNLKAIVFIWDEFTKYFENNMSDLTSFQRLAELSETDPFYLVIVTHKSEGIFAENDNDKKLLGRFVSPTCLIELPDTMAFRLMGEAMEKTKDPIALEEWGEMLHDLFNRTQDSRQLVLKQLQKKDPKFTMDDMAKILPMHPYAALLLKHLSAQFASNQRSMFDFIKNDKGDDIHGFQWYIKNYGPEDDYPLLTIDMLWNFFYENGKEQLSSDVRNILNHYNSAHPDQLLEQQRKVLKTILLMTAISQSLGDSVELFIPTPSNIANAFEGIESMEGMQAINAARSLVDAHILYNKKLKDNKECFAPLMTAIDTTKKVESEKLIDQYTTTKLVEDAGFNSEDGTRNPTGKLLFLSPISNRFRFMLVGQDSFGQRVRRFRENPIPGRISVVMGFAKNDAESAAIGKLVKEYINNPEYDSCKIIYISAKTPLGMELYGRYKDNLSDSMTFAGNDRGNENERRREALKVLNQEWGSKLESGAFEVDWKKRNGEYVHEFLPDFSSLKDYLLHTVDRDFYPQGFEWRYTVAANLYKLSNARQGVKSAVTGICEGTFNNPNKQLKTEQVVEGAWKTDFSNKYWEEFPGLPISNLKIRIEEKIKSDFKAEGRVSIRSIYDVAKDEPFGLMPCNLTAFILGFVLREYTSDQYRYTDDQTSDVMNSVHLQTMIDEIIKNQENPDKRYRDKYIVTMTPGEKEFHRVASSVFGIPIELCTSIQITRDRIRNKMKELAFPLWTLKFVTGSLMLSTNKETVDKAIDFFGELANSGNTSEVDIANHIGQLSLTEKDLINDLVLVVTKDNCRNGMAKYLSEYKQGELVELSKEVNDAGQYLNIVAGKFTNVDAANWVWNRDTANQRIDEVIIEYKIIAETNKLLSSSQFNLKGALEAWKSQCNLIRISYEAMKDQLGNLASFMGLLKELKSIGQLLPSKEHDFYVQLSNNADEIKSFLNNQKAIFKNVCAFSLEGLDEDDVDRIFRSIHPQNNAFILPKGEYISLIDNIVQEYKKSQKKEQLKKLWHEKTGTDSPRAWSEKYKTPILAMIPSNELDKAKKAFICFSNVGATNDEVQDAIAYISSADFLTNLEDENARDAAFKLNILKEYAVVLEDCNAVREYLQKYFFDVYDWYGDNLVEKRIKEFAEHEYSTVESKKVIKIIQDMSDAELKQYLIQLAQDNVLLGIQILKSKG